MRILFFVALMAVGCKRKATDYMIRSNAIDHRSDNPCLDNQQLSKIGAFGICLLSTSYSVNKYFEDKSGIWNFLDLNFVANGDKTNITGLKKLFGGTANQTVVSSGTGRKYPLSALMPASVQALVSKALVSKALVAKPDVAKALANPVPDTPDTKGFVPSQNWFATINYLFNRTQEGVFFKAKPQDVLSFLSANMVPVVQSNMIGATKNRLEDSNGIHFKMLSPGDAVLFFADANHTKLIHLAVFIERDLFFHQLETPNGYLIGFVGLNALLDQVSYIKCGRMEASCRLDPKSEVRHMRVKSDWFNESPQQTGFSDRLTKAQLKAEGFEPLRVTGKSQSAQGVRVLGEQLLFDVETPIQK